MTGQWRTVRRCATGLAALLLGPSGIACGQQDAAFSGFQLNRSLPGARSLAMGGSFVAVADDATAAYANPAGLTLLYHPEASAEGRSWQNRFHFTDHGRIEGPLSSEGIDTTPGIVRGAAESTATDLSFLSYVEARRGRKWVAGLFYRTYAEFDLHFNSEGVFNGPPGIPRFGPYRFQTHFLVRTVGVSYAYEFGSCKDYRPQCLRLGATVSDYILHLSSVEDVLADPPTHGPADFTAPLRARARRTASGSSPGLNLGALYEYGPGFKFALAYRQGPSFSMFENIFNVERHDSIELPSEYSAGISWSNRSTLLVSLEVDRVTYSRLIAGNSFHSFSLPDGTEVRLGGEFVVHQNSIGDRRVSVMVGTWYDPDHHITFKGSIADQIDLFRKAYFPGEAAQVHGSAGLSLHWGSFSTNVAADVSRQTRTVSVSEIYRI